MLDTDDKTANLIDDKDIALSSLTASKLDISLLSKAIGEATNPQLSQMLASQLNSCINDHFKLSYIVINEGRYPAYATPQEQLKNDLTKAEKVIKEE
ncbi:spore coat protein [Clostridium sp. Marseille-QA1073]